MDLETPIEEDNGLSDIDLSSELDDLLSLE